MFDIEIRGLDYSLRKMNELKEKEMPQQRLQYDRKEWIRRLERATDRGLYNLLSQTDKFIKDITTLKSGSSTLYTFESEGTLNPEWQDIANEIIGRGLSVENNPYKNL
ncbi:MAG: hypothetical protein ACRDD7_12880 [Peptostreptococcaceae bacterium]